MTGDRLAIPEEALQARSIVQRCLTESLLAIYLHGSAVGCGLRPDSDVDLLVVVDQPMTLPVRRCLLAELMAVSGRHPAEPGGPRPLELIIFQRADLISPTYPPRCAFIYGEWLRQAFEAGEVPEPVSDPELTLVLAQARQEASPLMGPDPAELLPVIARTDILRATRDILPTLLERMEGDERNVLLTLTRMWRTLETGDFVAKDVAAEWAVPRLSASSAALVENAREAYLGLRKDEWQPKQQIVRDAARELSEKVCHAGTIPRGR